MSVAQLTRASKRIGIGLGMVAAVPIVIGLAALGFATYDERNSPWLALVVVLWLGVVYVYLRVSDRLTWNRTDPKYRKAPKRRR